MKPPGRRLRPRPARTFSGAERCRRPRQPGLLRVRVQPRPGWAGCQSSFLHSRDRKQSRSNSETKNPSPFRHPLVLSPPSLLRLPPTSALLGRVPHCLPQDQRPVNPPLPTGPGEAPSHPKMLLPRLAGYATPSAPASCVGSASCWRPSWRGAGGGERRGRLVSTAEKGGLAGVRWSAPGREGTEVRDHLPSPSPSARRQSWGLGSGRPCSGVSPHLPSPWKLLAGAAPLSTSPVPSPSFSHPAVG